MKGVSAIHSAVNSAPFLEHENKSRAKSVFIPQSAKAVRDTSGSSRPFFLMYYALKTSLSAALTQYTHPKQMTDAIQY